MTEDDVFCTLSNLEFVMDFLVDRFRKIKKLHLFHRVAVVVRQVDISNFSIRRTFSSALLTLAGFTNPIKVPIVL